MFLNAGVKPPRVGTACELGFGQGMSANLHAAVSVVEWCGTDFNPAQAGFAQELAAVAGSGARLFDQAFDEFCSRSDLPEFDYIGLHGIWSWISDATLTLRHLQEAGHGLDVYQVFHYHIPPSPFIDITLTLCAMKRGARSCC